MKNRTTPRSLELFFVDGDPDGMLTATVPFQWSGHVLLASRTQLREALKRPETSRPGVYLLVGENESGALLYIGESDDIGNRIKNHDANKDWWSTAIFITSNGDQLNKAHARYLESRLIEKAKQVNKIPLENGTAPALPALSEAALAHMEDFLDNIYLVLPALKYDFFLESTRTNSTAQRGNETSDSSPTFVRNIPKSDNLTATAHIEGSHFVVEAGSKARGSWIQGQTSESSYGKLYTDLVAQGILESAGDHRVFTKSYAFNSPSAAGAIVNGRATNGTTAWKIKGSDKTYKEWEQEQLIKEQFQGEDAA